MAVEGAPQIAPLDEVRELSRLGGGDLTLVLAELGRNKIKPERLVEPLLVTDLGRLLRTLGNREAVFIERPSVIQCAAAEADVVLLASGEIDKRERILLGLHDTQIALDTTLKSDTRFRRAVDDDFLHERMVNEKLGNFLGVL